jgi:hypothetical protein
MVPLRGTDRSVASRRWDSAVKAGDQSAKGCLRLGIPAILNQKRRNDRPQTSASERPRRGRPDHGSGPTIGPSKETTPAWGKLGPKLGRNMPEGSRHNSDVGARSADPIKFCFREWPDLKMRGTQFGGAAPWALGLFYPGA